MFFAELCRHLINKIAGDSRNSLLNRMPGSTESSSSVSNCNSDDFGNVRLVCMVSFSACASYSHVTHNLVAVVGPLSIGKRELSEGLNNRSKVNFVLLFAAMAL